MIAPKASSLEKNMMLMVMLTEGDATALIFVEAVVWNVNECTNRLATLGILQSGRKRLLSLSKDLCVSRGEACGFLSKKV